MSQRSHIEVGGWAARHYDLSMDLLLVGRYQAFIEGAIERMDIRRGDAILDLGSGTGRNICVMMEFLGSTGRVVGVDISQEMLRQARRRCRAYAQVSFLERRIEEPLPFHQEFDKAFISFTLHGFEDEDKEGVIANAYRALKPGGIFWILDYNEFDLNRQWFPFRWAFRRLECELASEFLSLDLEGMLAHWGFSRFVMYPFLWGYVRLLGAEKTDGQTTPVGGRKRQRSNERIEELERQIAELKRRWPAHSVPPTMLEQLDELEEELEKGREEAKGDNAKAEGPGGLQEMPT